MQTPNVSVSDAAIGSARFVARSRGICHWLPTTSPRIFLYYNIINRLWLKRAGIVDACVGLVFVATVLDDVAEYDDIENSGMIFQREYIKV